MAELIRREKSYFLHLKALIALEEAEERQELLQAFSALTPKERELRGKALLKLVLEGRHFDVADHALLVFRRQQKHPLPLFSLEVGDLVGLFPEGGKGREAVIGTVYEKTSHAITVAFRPQLPDWIGEEPRYELHQAVNRATYERMAQALEAVYAAEGTRLAYFRELSLGQRQPGIERVAMRDIRWCNSSLNASQREAVRRALAAKDLALIHGPPGTGKTTVLIEIIRQSVTRRESVLVNAPSNTACDFLLEQLVASGINALRLGHPARVDVALREHTLDFKLALHPVGKQVSEAQQALQSLFRKQDRSHAHRSATRETAQAVREQIAALKREVRALRQEVFERVMEETQVIVGTLTSIHTHAVRERQVDLLVIDEASQATEPLTWIPITRAKKVIMAGDHCQLPPVIRSKEAEAKGLGITLFERLHELLGDASKTLLERQYRMHERIMGFSSMMFYDNRLVADESVKRHTLAELPRVQSSPETIEPLLFVDTAGKGFEERLEEGSESRYNPEEAELVLSIVRTMLERGVVASGIAIISPYSAQVRWLASRSPNPKIEIDSVDGFQGREKELVIVSLVRANMEGELGFLADTRRMNVAMTRARRKLVVIGDSSTLSAIPFYRSFIDYAERIGGYRSAWAL